MKRIFHGLMLICLGASALSLHAGDRRDTKAHDAAVAKTRQDAIAKVEGDDIDGAADLVGDHSTTQKHSLIWYQESAIELTNEALILQAARDHEGARRAGQAALKFLKHALKAKGSNATASDRAQMYIQMAQLHELILGDAPNARKAYEAALKETPDSALVKRELARFAAADEKFERIKSRKK